MHSELTLKVTIDGDGGYAKLDVDVDHEDRDGIAHHANVVHDTVVIDQASTLFPIHAWALRTIISAAARAENELLITITRAEDFLIQDADKHQQNL